MQTENLQGEIPAEDAVALPVETEEVEQEEAEVSESSTEQESAEPQPRKLRGVEKRISELTANWREEQRRSQQLQEMLEKALSGRQEQKAPEPAQQQPQGEPRLDQFQTYEEYVSALADYKADQKLKAFEEQIRQRELQSQQAVKAQEFQSRLAAAKMEMPDFDMVALNPTLPVSDVMADLIRDMDDGPRVLYALGQNPSEAARIASLPDRLAAVELGKFAVKASLPQPKRQTSAPPPVAPLSGGIGTRNPNPDEMPMDEWVKWRNQQLGR